jgi:phenylalanyl-tRNA synthetase beta chain
MNISLKSIEKFTKVNIAKEDIEQRISTQLVNVEGLEELSNKYMGILVAQIAQKADHPTGEKLAVYQVDIGGKVVQVVTADKLLEIGDKCAYLAPGIRVPFNAYPDRFDGIIKAMELRGVMSEGMLASAKELEFSLDHERVLVLDTDAKAGTPLSDVYELNDIIVDAENKGLTNRPETFGIIGFARELSGIQGMKFNTPDWFAYQNAEYKSLYVDLMVELDRLKSNEIKTRAGFSVKHQADKFSPRYMLISLDNVNVKPSPVWLQVELMKAGVRSINNVVDITNYMMVMTGQPMHAMDYDKCNVDAEGKVNIVVRKANAGERLTVIDGKSIELDTEMVVICDDTGPQDLAGIMGGLSSEITNDTTRVLLECANFDMYNIRKTSNKTGIKSDAMTRFARNQDPNMCEAVMFKALEMFKDLAGAQIASQLVDIFPYPREQKRISVSISRLNGHLGVEFDVKKIAEILGNVELKVEEDSTDSDKIIVVTPTYRQDLNIFEDIHEEVARLYSYNKIEVTLPTRTIAPTPRNKDIAINEKVRSILVSMGAYELLTYNFIGESLFKKSGQDLSLAYHIKNALSPELEFMRTSLTPSLLEKVSMNHSSGYEEFALTEINKSHIKGVMDEESLPYEWKMNSFIFSASDKLAKSKYDGSPFYMAKLYLNKLLAELKSKSVQYEALSSVNEINELPIWLKNILPLFNSKLSGLVTYEFQNKKYYLGIVGEYSSSVKTAFALPNYVGGYEINLENLMQIANVVNNYIEPSKYPSTTQDLCFIADKDVPYSAIENSILQELMNLTDVLTQLEPVDIYMPESTPEIKQVTMRISLQGRSSVLDEKLVDDLRKRIIRNVLQVTGAKLK